MAAIRASGFEATSLWWEEADPVRRGLRDEAVRWVREAGLRLDSLHAPYRGCNALWCADAALREAETARHIGWVGDCARHGVPRLVMHLTMERRPEAPSPAGLDSLRRIVEAAAEAGVIVCIENTRDPDHIDAVLEAIASPYLGLCYDSSHDRLYSPEPVAMLRRWSHRLEAMHLSDTDGRRDYHWLPGAGVVDFEAVAEAVPASYGGAWMLEVHCDEKGAECGAFLKRARAAFEEVVLGTPFSA